MKTIIASLAIALLLSTPAATASIEQDNMVRQKHEVAVLLTAQHFCGVTLKPSSLMAMAMYASITTDAEKQQYALAVVDWIRNVRGIDNWCTFVRQQYGDFFEKDGR